MEKEYWENYYKTHRNGQPPTPFAQEVLKYLIKGKEIIELGSGNGRDSVYFEKQGLRVTGVDQCEEEIAYLNNKYASNNLIFKADDFTRMKNGKEYDYVYSRFTLHAVDENAENRVLKWTHDSLKQGGYLFLELRSVNDELYHRGQKKKGNVSITDHYRRFAEQGKLEEKLKENNFEIIQSIESKGLAPYGNEDPIVIRIIAKK